MTTWKFRGRFVPLMREIFYREKKKELKLRGNDYPRGEGKILLQNEDNLEKDQLP